MSKETNVESVRSGLCQHCVNAAECTLLESCQRLVFYCDEFQLHATDEAAGRTEVAVGDPSHIASDAAETAVDELARTNGRLGLCSSCAGWESCRYAYAEAGVWHCDEYR